MLRAEIIDERQNSNEETTRRRRIDSESRRTAAEAGADFAGFHSNGSHNQQAAKHRRDRLIRRPDRPDRIRNQRRGDDGESEQVRFLELFFHVLASPAQRVDRTIRQKQRHQHQRQIKNDVRRRQHTLHEIIQMTQNRKIRQHAFARWRLRILATTSTSHNTMMVPKLSTAAMI